MDFPLELREQGKSFWEGACLGLSLKENAKTLPISVREGWKEVPSVNWAPLHSFQTY
jgi:hypothetical protein